MGQNKHTHILMQTQINQEPYKSEPYSLSSRTDKISKKNLKTTSTQCEWVLPMLRPPPLQTAELPVEHALGVNYTR